MSMAQEQEKQVSRQSQPNSAQIPPNNFNNLKKTQSPSKLYHAEDTSFNQDDSQENTLKKSDNQFKIFVGGLPGTLLEGSNPLTL